MNLGNIFGSGHQVWHWPKRISLEIHIQACNNYPHPFVGQVVAYCNYLIVKKLRLIYPHHITIIGK